MQPFLAALHHRPLLADGALGSYLFALTGRVSEQNHLYEAFNLARPELVRQLHLEYLQAGAQCLTSNSFAANATYPSAAPIAEINATAVRLAREAIDQYRQQDQCSAPLFVLGSLGPPLPATQSPRTASDLYRAQIETLVESGVDALLLETFTCLEQVVALLELLQDLDNPAPVIVQMALHQRDGTWKQSPQAYVQTAAALGAHVVGINCCALAEARAFLDAVQECASVRDGQVQLAVMPNGGDFRRVGHRYLTGVNPECMGRFAREMAHKGVRLIGGCCEVHPPHVHEMYSYLHSLAAGESTVPLARTSDQQPTDAAAKRRNGPFSRKLVEGQFAVSVELLPPRGTGGLKARLAFVAELAASGLVDALDITDGSRGIPLMPPGDFVHLIRHRLRWSRDLLELIPHCTSRDLNTMGLQSRLIGYWANRIHNVLFITGDPPKMAPTYPRSTAVFDLDSTALIRYTHAFLNAGLDFGGQPLGSHRDPRTHFTIGTGCEPEALDLQREWERLAHKIDAGADYVMTQPTFDRKALAALTAYRAQVPIVVGVMVLRGLEHARRIAEVPGVVVPEKIFARLAAYADPADQAKTGIELAAEQVRQVRAEGWSGLYLMSPAGHQPVLEVLKQGLD